MALILPLLLLAFASSVSADEESIPVDLCVLPGGRAGRQSLLEDCETLEGHESPPALLNYAGSTAVVCCPPVQEVVEKEEDDYYSYDEGEEEETSFADYYDPPSADFFARKCLRHAGTACSAFSDCAAADFQGDRIPPTCGYDKGAGLHRFCCKDRSNNSTEEVESPRLVRIERVQGRLRRYPCEDHVSECNRWARDHPDSCSDPAHEAFGLMSLACMESCNRCGSVRSSGCVDELEKCDEWARLGCAKNPDSMSIYCRASCGTCGFYSPRNVESQVIDGRSYSDPKDERFFCGAGESLDAINAKSVGEEEETREYPDSIITFSRKKRQAGTVHQGGRFNCGSVVISDRFALTAAHCQLYFGDRGGPFDNPKTVLLRDGTGAASLHVVKRAFSHPEYSFPSLYSNIALLELDRRIEYNYDQFGDSPSCLGEEGAELTGKRATIEGYGKTEDGAFSEVMLTANVTVISNEMCSEMLKHNASTSVSITARLSSSLQNGLNDQILCTQGDHDEASDVWSGPCRGDSGGPLYVNYGTAEIGEDRRQTLEGIISGGLACGKNFPSWYTRVSSHRPWIDCVMREVKKWNSKAKVEKICKKAASTFEPKNLVGL